MVSSDVTARAYDQNATPVQIVTVPCPLCSREVHVPVVREFIRVWRRVCAHAGMRFDSTLPMVAHRCTNGHVVTLCQEQLASVH